MNIYEFDIINEDDIYNFFGETTVYADNKKKLYIAIHPDEGRNFETDPYIKVSWQSNFSKNDKVARLDLKKGNYIIHNGMTVDVPNKIAKQINKALSSKCKDKDVVDKIKNSINEELDNRDDLSDKEKKQIQDQDITYMDAILFDAFERVDSISSYIEYRDNIESKAKEFKNLQVPKKVNVYKWGN